MRLSCLSFLLFLFCSSAFAQVNTNPFEIQTRLDSVYNSEATDEGSTFNIFDVQRSDEELIPVEPTKQDSLEEESDLMPTVGEEEIEDESQFGQNPFDVSHIPIRRSKLKKEANALKTQSKKIDIESGGSNAFLFFLNLLSAFLLAIVINTQRGALKKVSNAITNENVLKLLHREEKRGITGHHLLLYISYFINAAIFVYLILYNFFELQGWKYFQWVFLGIVGIYLTRHLFLTILGRIFPIKKDSQLFGFTIQTFNIFLGILLIPFNLIIAFGPLNATVPLIYIGLVIIGILTLLRTFRGFLIASSYIQSNLFHFLLYLCTFEILPILLLIKIIGNFGIA
ncbi:MAG: DUF4271 domain-containing protein [Bacteroidota bacterium]